MADEMAYTRGGGLWTETRAYRVFLFWKRILRFQKKKSMPSRAHTVNSLDRETTEDLLTRYVTPTYEILKEQRKKRRILIIK